MLESQKGQRSVCLILPSGNIIQVTIQVLTLTVGKFKNKQTDKQKVPKVQTTKTQFIPHFLYFDTTVLFSSHLKIAIFQLKLDFPGF